MPWGVMSRSNWSDESRQTDQIRASCQTYGTRKWIRKAGVEDIVTPIVKTSEEAAKTLIDPIEFLFIDGAHEYEFARLDCELWLPKVVPGGMVAMHDTTTFPGPNRAVKEQILAFSCCRAAGPPP